MSERLSGWEGNNFVRLSWSSSGCARSPSGWPSGDLPAVAVAFSGGPLGQQDAARRCQSPRRSAHLRVPAGDEEHGGQSSGQLAQRWGRRLCCVVPPALLFGTRLYCGGFSFLSSWENNKTFFLGMWIFSTGTQFRKSCHCHSSFFFLPQTLDVSLHVFHDWVQHINVIVWKSNSACVYTQTVTHSIHLPAHVHTHTHTYSNTLELCSVWETGEWAEPVM